MIKDRSKLTTEQSNPRSAGLDAKSTLGIIDTINSEDMLVAEAVGRCRCDVAEAVDVIVERFRDGGRLFYVGAGTSGRLGVLDASECPPTFGTPPSMVQGIIAGGKKALVRAVEGAEDDELAGMVELKKKNIASKDIVVGIAACGITPFVMGAMKFALVQKCAVIFVTCSSQVARRAPADIVICADVGPEILTGSTRMKSGTATKLILNTLTTASMVKLGKVYDNFMVDLRATNEKLKDRSQRIVMKITGVSRIRAKKLLELADGGVKLAIVIHSRGVCAKDGKKLLDASKGNLRAVIENTSSQRG